MVLDEVRENSNDFIEKTVKVLGFGFTKRQELFYNGLKKHCGSYSNNIVVTRATFLKDLLDYAPESKILEMALF